MIHADLLGITSLEEIELPRYRRYISPSLVSRLRPDIHRAHSHSQDLKYCEAVLDNTLLSGFRTKSGHLVKEEDTDLEYTRKHKNARSNVHECVNLVEPFAPDPSVSAEILADHHSSTVRA